MADKWIPDNGRLIHEDTGEIVVPGFLPLRKGRNGSNFWMMALHAGELLATNRELSGQDLRVFLFLTSRLEYENVIHITQTSIAESMGISRQAVCASIATLVKQGIVERLDRGSYRLDPYLGFRGKVANHKKLMRERGMKVIKGAKTDQSE